MKPPRMTPRIEIGRHWYNLRYHLRQRGRWYGPGLRADIDELASVILSDYPEAIFDGSAPKVAAHILRQSANPPPRTP